MGWMLVEMWMVGDGEGSEGGDGGCGGDWR